MAFQNQGSPMGFENYEDQSQSSVNYEQRNHKLSILYTNADNLMNKRNDLQAIITCNNPDFICITESLPKNALLPIEECELQIKGYIFHSNNNII